jgi:hypothetical protein
MKEVVFKAIISVVALLKQLYSTDRVGLLGPHLDIDEHEVMANKKVDLA